MQYPFLLFEAFHGIIFSFTQQTFTERVLGVGIAELVKIYYIIYRHIMYLSIYMYIYNIYVYILYICDYSWPLVNSITLLLFWGVRKALPCLLLKILLRHTLIFLKGFQEFG